jgi:hypothetical protein
MNDISTINRAAILVVIAMTLTSVGSLAPVVATAASSVMSVFVTNTSAKPIPVDVRNSAVIVRGGRAPFNGKGLLILSSGQYTNQVDAMTGASGQWTVLRSISVNVLLPAGQRMTDLFVQFGSLSYLGSRVYIPLTYMGTYDGQDRYQGAVSGEWILSPTDTLGMYGFRNSGTDMARVLLGFQGYSTAKAP